MSRNTVYLDYLSGNKTSHSPAPGWLRAPRAALSHPHSVTDSQSGRLSAGRWSTCRSRVRLTFRHSGVAPRLPAVSHGIAVDTAGGAVVGFPAVPRSHVVQVDRFSD